MKSDTPNVTRYFRPCAGGGYIRVDHVSSGWLWTRKHGNGTVSSSPKAFDYATDAVMNAGGDVHKEYVPTVGSAERCLLDDVYQVGRAPEHVRSTELVHRLRRLDQNEIGSDLRLLRDLWDHTNDQARDQLSPRTRSRIEMLVDREKIICALESLPVNEKASTTSPTRAMYFILSGGAWVAVSAGTEHTVGNIRWLNARVDSPDGRSSDCMPVRWPEWAHASADGQPCIDF